MPSARFPWVMALACLQASVLQGGWAMPAMAETYAQPLAAEPIPATATLPAAYPQSWIYVHDLNFNSLIDGRAAIVDVAADSNALKG